MKKIYLFILLISLIDGGLKAQNGVATYSCNINAPNNNFYKRTALAIDNAGNKWIGLQPLSYSISNFELLRFNGTTWDSFPHVPSHKINALAFDASNNLWIGTDSGLVKYNGLNYTVYNIGNSNIASNVINCITTGNGIVYAGTNGGLCVFNGSTFTNFNHINNGLSHDTIISLAYEGSAAIWLGNNYGFEKFDGLNFTFYNNLGGIGSDKINCIYVDQQGAKWLGTNAHGVVKYDGTGFYTMQQLFGQFAIVGGLWPSSTLSINEGPSGGVAFMLWHNNYGSYDCAGTIEILSNGSSAFYKNVGIYHSVGSTPNSIFGFDPVSNKLFYISTMFSSLPRVFLYSFDKSQYSNAFAITSANSDYLDINQVAALITANSDMGSDGMNTRYFAPKNQNSSPLRAASLWMGGYNNGTLHLAAMTYRQGGQDFWPGPLDTITGGTDTSTSLMYNKVWKVNRFDIANFIYNWNAGNVQNGTFLPATSILNWPAHGTGNYSSHLAPFVDVNGNGVYDPIHDGDYPLIKGDQMIWWVMHDAFKHEESGSLPFNAEIHASAYAYVCPNIVDSNQVLNYTTFYNYKIINRSQNQYDSCYLTNWMDTDLGNYMDDYIGCDVMNNYGFVFNGDSYDEDTYGLPGYHDNLPAFSCNVLNGPAANTNDGWDNDNNGIIDEPGEKNLLHSFTYYTNTGDVQTGNPNANAPQQYYNFMHGVWKNGTPMTYGGNGTSPTNPFCRHLFPGNSDPYGISRGGSITNPIAPPGSFGSTGWTMKQANVVKNDMRFLTGVGPFTMQPGGTYEFDCAFVFSQDSLNCAGDTVLGGACVLPRLQQDNIRVKRWFDNNSFPSCLSLSGVGIKENAAQQVEVSVYPNPASDQLFVEFKAAQEKVTVELFDMLGKLVKGATYTDSRKYISVPVQELGSGVYMIRIKTGSGVQVKRFVKE